MTDTLAMKTGTVKCQHVSRVGIVEQTVCIMYSDVLYEAYHAVCHAHKKLGKKQW